MRNSIRVFLAVLAAASARGQIANSRLEVIVQDPSGAVVPAAKITALDNRTALSTGAAGEARGSFVFLSLPPGDYTVTVDAPGFRKLVFTGVALTAGATVVENIRLELGPVADAILVEAKQTAVDGSDSQVNRVVALHDLEILPQLERNPITLAIFQPGVQIRGGNIGFSRINGTRQGSNSVRVDGIESTETISPALAFSANASTTDSVREFRIVTHGGTAEYGSHAGAQVEMITRSGTNRWSGNAFDYLRNTDLNANDFFNNSFGGERPKFIQNVFGGSLGGPLKRNRTFLFGSFQGTRSRQEFVRNRNVITQSARDGLFRWRTPGSTAVQEFDIVRNDPRGKGIDPQMAAQIRSLPAPNNYDIGDGLNTAGYRFNSPSNSAQDGFTIRADHNLRNGLRLFSRLSWLRADYIDSLNGAEAPFPGQVDGTASVRAWGYSIGADWTLNPRMANEARVGRYGAPRAQLRPARTAEPMFLINSWTSPVNIQFERRLGATNHEFTDNFSTVHGQHLVKIGLNWRFGAQFNETQGDNGSATGIYPNVSFGRNFGNAPAASIGPAAPAISAADRARFENLYNPGANIC